MLVFNYKEENGLYLVNEFSGADNEKLYYQLCKSLPDKLGYKTHDTVTAFDGDNYQLKP